MWNDFCRACYRSPLLGGYVYLTGTERALAARGAAGVTWWGVMVASLAWGLFAAGVWSVGNVLFGSKNAAPGLLTAAAMLLWPMRRALTSLASLGTRESASRSLTLAVLAAGAIVLVLEVGAPVYPPKEDWLWWGIAWAFPHEHLQHFRALILAPLWGVWAMLAAPKLCRPDGRLDAATRALADSGGPVLTSALLVVPLGATMLYFQWMGWWVFIPAAAPLATAVLTPTLLARLGAALCRRTLLASNALAQLALLLAYLVGRYYWTVRG